MASINVTIPDEVLTRVLDAFDKTYTREEGDTKAHHAKKQVIKFVKDTVKNYEAQQAQKEQAETTESEVDLS